MPAAIQTAFDRPELAKWYAKRHYETDAGVQAIYHLPTNAPPREIRLLEINSLIAETTPLEPIDFGVAIDGDEPHTLLVLDVTPLQWAAIQSGGLPLPCGWSRERAQPLLRPQSV